MSTTPPSHGGFKPIKLTDLKLSLDDAKLIADGAAVFSTPGPDPEDAEKLHPDAAPAE